MSKQNNLTDFLTGVANAIRTKKGTTGAINPQNFESEIENIQTGGGVNPAIIEGTITEIEAEDLAGVTKIRDYAFYMNNDIISIAIPDSVINIGDATFAGCGNLESITIGSGITSIGHSVFQACGSLMSITCLATTPPSLGVNSFFNVPETCVIKVPAESLEAYKTAPNWSERADYIQAEGTPSYTWKCTVANLGSQDPSNVTFTHEGTMPTFEEYTDTLNNVFIKIPTMYRKVNTVVDDQITSFTIADGQIDSTYEPYPVFVKEDETTVMPYVLMGKYYNTASDSVVSTTFGKKSLAPNTAREYARSLGDGYQLFDWQFQKLWQDLIICKMNTVNVNTGSDKPARFCDAFGIAWLGTDTYVIDSYVDGIARYDDRSLIFASKPSLYIDNPTTASEGYIKTNYLTPDNTNNGNCISKLGYDENNAFVNYPTATTGASSFNVYYCDVSQTYYATGNHPLIFGVFVGNARQGAFNFNANTSNWTNTLVERLCCRPV